MDIQFIIIVLSLLYLILGISIIVLTILYLQTKRISLKEKIHKYKNIILIIVICLGVFSYIIKGFQIYSIYNKDKSYEYIDINIDEVEKEFNDKIVE